MNQYQYNEELIMIRLALCNAKIHQNIINQELTRLSIVERLEREVLIKERIDELHRIFHPEQYPNNDDDN